MHYPLSFQLYSRTQKLAADDDAMQPEGSSSPAAPNDLFSDLDLESMLSYYGPHALVGGAGGGLLGLLAGGKRGALLGSLLGAGGMSLLQHYTGPGRTPTPPVAGQ